MGRLFFILRVTLIVLVGPAGVAGCSAPSQPSSDTKVDASGVDAGDTLADAGPACTPSDCPRGVCGPDGACIDAAPCASSSECLAGKSCVQGDCRPDTALCGDDPCPGNQVCDYDASTLTAQCQEPASCETSRDCLEGRVCAGEHCLAAPPCEPDPFEPNNTQAQAPDFGLRAPRGSVEASLCVDDQDVYALEVEAPTRGSLDGEIYVALDYSRRQVGLAEPRVELIGPEGSLDSATAGDDAALELRAPLSDAQPGTYYVVVDAPGAAGAIHYTLFADRQPAEVAEACDAPPAISPGDPLTSDNVGSAFGQIRASCADAATGGADIYALEVDEKSRVSVTVESQQDHALFGVSLRGECRRSDTELACTDAPGATGTLSAPLAPGRYFIQVQSPSEVDEGSYTIEVDAEPVGCTAADNHCSQPGTAQICADGGSLQEQQCQLGCQPHSGTCRVERGETCASAEHVTESTTIEIDWSNLDADNTMPRTSCVPSVGGSNQTTGPDAFYRVDMPAQHVLVAELSADDLRDVSIYLLDDCPPAASECLAAANEDYVDAERIVFYNDADSPRSVWLAADALLAVTGTAELDIRLAPIVCQSWESRCHDGDVQTCNTLRDAFETADDCKFGCTQAACDPPPGDECPDAVAMSDGQTYSGEFGDYSSSVAADLSRCTAAPPSLHDPLDGPEAFFTLDLAAGELLRATLTSAETSAAMYVADGCPAASLGNCTWAQFGTDTLEFHAPQTGTYLLGVEAARSATAAFDLHTEIVSNTGGCQPGGATCEPSSRELAVCNDTGTAEVARYACAAGCAAQTCNLPATTHDTCANALSVGEGARFLDDLTNFGDDHLGPGRDAVYSVAVDADDVFEAFVRATGFSTPNIYLFDDCSSFAKPIASARGGQRVASLRHRFAHTQTVYVVVDFTGSVSDPDFLVDLRTTASNCQPGDLVCGAGGALRHCVDGLLEEYACAGGCTNASCDTPRGDICWDAVPVSDGQTVEGLLDGVDDVSFNLETAGQCRFGAQSRSSGPDTFYRIDLNAGDLLETTLLTFEADATVYFLEDCTQRDHCTPGIAAPGQTTAHYYAEAAGPVYVAVDRAAPNSTGASPAGYSLSFDVVQGASCAPNRPFCVDGNTVAICDAAGAQPSVSANCPTSCARGACRPDVANADACATAPLVESGFTTYLDFADFTDDLALPTADCTRFDSSRPNAAYRIDVGADEVLHVRGQGDRGAIGPIPYVIGDCASPDTTCLAGPQSEALLTEDGLFFAPGAARTVTVVVEANSDTTAQLSLETIPAECFPGARQCVPGGGAAQFCTEYRRWKTIDCANGCSAGQCTPPVGDICRDAIPITAPQSLAGDFGVLQDDAETRCSLSSYGDGPDAFYSVDLQAGDRLEARVVSSDDADIVVLGGCSSAERSQCLAESGEDGRVQFRAQTAGTYILAVDAGLMSAARDFALEVDIAPGTVCLPGTTRCDESAGIVQVCRGDGFGYNRFEQCASGCNGSRCAGPATPNDTCATAHAVGDGVVLRDDLARFNDDVSSVPSCGISSTDGRDAVYRVDLQAGQIVEAALDVEESSRRPTLYISTDCADLGNTCVASSVGELGPARTGYMAQTAETVYVVVDLKYSHDVEFDLDIDVRTADCSPGSGSCVDGSTASVCNAWGALRTEQCRFGCSGGACNRPADDTCTGATLVPRDGELQSHRLRFDAYGDDYDLQNNTTAACDRLLLDGPDAVFRLDAQQGDHFEAAWDPAGLRGWIVDDCTSAQDNCLAQAVRYDATSLDYIIPADGSYWFILDSQGSNPLPDTAQIDLRLSPRICQPGATTCSPTPGLLRYCDAGGTAWKDYACSGGCVQQTSSATCAAPRGEHCFDAIDATGGGRFWLQPEALDETFNPADIGCISSFWPITGGDAIYRVDLQTGQTLDAAVYSWSTDPVIYILDDCGFTAGAPSGQCLAGAIASGSTDPALSWTAPAAQTVYLVVDHDGQVSPQDEWLVDIQIN